MNRRSGLIFRQTCLRVADGRARAGWAVELLAARECEDLATKYRDNFYECCGVPVVYGKHATACEQEAGTRG